MNKLREKTFYTIFSIISLFIVIAILIFNIQSYQKEYAGIENNLHRMSNLFVGNPRPNNNQNDRRMIPNDLDNRIIMDYNFYTILLDNDNNIIDKISHNENQLNEEILDKATSIISNSNNSEIKINCLYFSKMAYNLDLGNFLIIVDTSNVQQHLLSILLFSIVLIIVFEVIVYYVSKKITDWITLPVEDSFNKQKEFIANASHELKTPLAVMIASLDCLEVSKKNEKWINNLKSESGRMNNLITRLLDLSKSESGLNKETYSINNLSKIVEKRALTFESLAFENGVQIDTNIEQNVMFKCNQTDIDELISIIIDNAIRHSFVNSRIMVSLTRVKNNIIIEISNKGEEIPKEDRDKIFERFYRGDKSRNRNSNRYGLGLAIARNIVQNHDGEICVYSENGYTTFKITFKNREH